MTLERLSLSLQEPETLRRWRALGVRSEELVDLFNGLGSWVTDGDQATACCAAQAEELFEGLARLKAPVRSLDIFLLSKSLEKLDGKMAEIQSGPHGVVLSNLLSDGQPPCLAGIGVAHRGAGLAAGLGLSSAAHAVLHLMQDQPEQQTQMNVQPAQPAQPAQMQLKCPLDLQLTTIMSGQVALFGEEEAFPWEEAVMQAEAEEQKAADNDSNWEGTKQITDSHRSLGSECMPKEPPGSSMPNPLYGIHKL